MWLIPLLLCKFKINTKKSHYTKIEVSRKYQVANTLKFLTRSLGQKWKSNASATIVLYQCKFTTLWHNTLWHFGDQIYFYWYRRALGTNFGNRGDLIIGENFQSVSQSFCQKLHPHAFGPDQLRLNILCGSNVSVSEFRICH